MRFRSPARREHGKRRASTQYNRDGRQGTGLCLVFCMGYGNNGCPTLRGVRSVGTMPLTRREILANAQHAAFSTGLDPQCSAVTATALPFMLYVAYAQPASSILWRGLLALHHNQLLPAMAAAGQWAQPRSVSAGAGADAVRLSLRSCRICRNAGARALADRRAPARRSVAGDESAEAGIRTTSAFAPAPCDGIG